MSVEELLAAIRAAEERLEIEPISIELFGDGSGTVMQPEIAPDGELCGGSGIHNFNSVEEAVEWLRTATLSEVEP